MLTTLATGHWTTLVPLRYLWQVKVLCIVVVQQGCVLLVTG